MCVCACVCDGVCMCVEHICVAFSFMDYISLSVPRPYHTRSIDKFVLLHSVIDLLTAVTLRGGLGRYCVTFV